MTPPNPSNREEPWSSHSAFYDSQIASMTQRSAVRLIALTHTLHPFSATDSYVLDNGAGTGSVTSALCAQFPGIRVLATDLSRTMLDVLNAKGLPNVVTRAVDAGVLDNAELGEDGVFSHALSTFMVQFVESPENVLKEMYRVLEPGGVLGVGIWGQSLGTVEIWQQACRTVEAGYVAPSPFKQGVWRTVEEVEAALGTVGFRDVKSEASRLHFEFADTRAFLGFVFESGHPTMVKCVQSWKGDLEVVKRALERIVREEYDDGKGIFLDVVLTVARK